MLRGLLLCFCYFVGMVLPAYAKDQDQDQRIAVLELRGKADRGELGLLSDEVRSGVLDATQGKSYIVMSRENMAVMAKEMGLDLSCIEGECEVETGRNIGAAYVVSGNIIRTGGRWVASIKVHDTDKGALLAADKVRGDEIDNLLDVLRPLAQGLTHKALNLAGAPLSNTPTMQTFGAPAQASSTSNFGVGISMNVEEKLRQKRCRQTAERQGEIQREQRLSEAVTELETQAVNALQILESDLRNCVQLDFDDREECLTAVSTWLSEASTAKVELPAGSEKIETECGPREAVFTATERKARIDTKPAKQWIEKLNDRGAVTTDNDAYSKGRMYEIGATPYSQDLKAAAGHYLNACNSAFGKACAALAHMHLSGRGGTSGNQSTASSFYTRGCEAGHGESCRRLGERTQANQGWQDINARTWFNRAHSLNYSACRRGHAEACHSLGRQYSLGQGVSQDGTKAAESYKKACTAGDGAGCRSMGYALINGRGIARNKSSGKTYYQKACRLNDGAGCRNYAIQLEVSRSTSAAQYYTKACALGDGRACAIYGYRAEKGRGMRKNYQTAATWYTKACKLGDAIGCNNLALASHWGRGVAKNITASTTYYRQACGLGYKSACGKR